MSNAIRRGSAGDDNAGVLVRRNAARFLAVCAVVFLLCITTAARSDEPAAASMPTLTIENGRFLVHGKPFQIICGEMRPGPYVCAEWEFGGYPAWLLHQHDLVLRSNDPRHLAAATQYVNHLVEQLVPLQNTRGGPIVMVQVERQGDFALKGSV